MQHTFNSFELVTTKEDHKASVSAVMIATIMTANSEFYSLLSLWHLIHTANSQNHITIIIVKYIRQKF